MNNKKVIIAVGILFAFCAGLVGFNILQKAPQDKDNVDIKSTDVKADKRTDLKDKKVKRIQETANTKEKESKENSAAKVNMYNDAVQNSIPLSAITEIATLPANVQAAVNKIVETNGIYALNHKKDKIVIIAEDTDNIRHGINFIEISIPSGHQNVTTLGYNGKIKDSENDIWDYNENQLPTRHTKYNKDGDIEFVETWNYDPENPIKYEMKNAEGKPLSIKKETITDGTDMRVEHLIYDTNGTTKINVSASFDGADIKRFTYYNADKLSDSVSVFGEYSDGLKVKETVYTPDLKVKNVYEADYVNGERKQITVFDDKNQKLKSYEQTE